MSNPADQSVVILAALCLKMVGGTVDLGTVPNSNIWREVSLCWPLEEKLRTLSQILERATARPVGELLFAAGGKGGPSPGCGRCCRVTPQAAFLSSGGVTAGREREVGRPSAVRCFLRFAASKSSSRHGFVPPTATAGPPPHNFYASPSV